MQTEMNSGFRLVPRIGMNSANAKKRAGKNKQTNKLSRKATEPGSQNRLGRPHQTVRIHPSPVMGLPGYVSIT